MYAEDYLELCGIIGQDAIVLENLMDPSGIDYRDYKRRYGHRVTLSGNIDIRAVAGLPAPATVSSTTSHTRTSRQ